MHGGYVDMGHHKSFLINKHRQDMEIDSLCPKYLTLYIVGEVNDIGGCDTKPKFVYSHMHLFWVAWIAVRKHRISADH